MRSSLVAAVLIGSVGCSSQGQLQYQSSIYSETRGVAFDSETSAQVGMVGNTCQVDVASGMIGEDTDVAAEADVVQQASGEEILVLGADGVHIHTRGEWGFGEYDPSIPGADFVAGRFVDGGVAGVRVTPAGVVVSWHGDQSGETSLPGSGPVTGVAADPASGAVLVADGEVAAVTPGEVFNLGAGDLVAWDSVLGHAYLATSGASELSAVRLDGSVVWATEVEGAVVSLTALGAQGAAMVSSEVGESGRLTVIDGATGEVRFTEVTPSAGHGLAASPEGSAFAVQVTRGNGAQQTMLYRLNP